VISAAANQGRNGLEVTTGAGRGRLQVIVGEPHMEGFAVGLAVNATVAMAEFPARTNHPQGNLPAVGDQHLLNMAGELRPRSSYVFEKVWSEVPSIAAQPQRELARVGEKKSAIS